VPEALEGTAEEDRKWDDRREKTRKEKRENSKNIIKINLPTGA
jgi:hypothetical protein